MRYETFRSHYLAGRLSAVIGDNGQDWERFSHLGFQALFQAPTRSQYNIHAHQAPASRWSGAILPGGRIVIEVFGRLLPQRPETHAKELVVDSKRS